MAENNEQLIVHYQLLPRRIVDDVNELRAYDCSECDADIFNLSIHAQVDHGTHLFDVVNDTEYIRPYDAPFHPCGILGCTLGPHSTETAHSWQVLPTPGVSTDDSGTVSEPTS